MSTNTIPNKKLNLGLLKRIFSYSKPYNKIFYSAILITITLSSLAIVRPLLINKMLNVVGANSSSDPNFLQDFEKTNYINQMGLILIIVLFMTKI